MKKFIGILLALAMLLCLCACGGGEPEPYFGHYEQVSMTYSGFAMPPDGEGYIDINSASKMKVFLEGDSYSGKLAVDGTNFVYTQSGSEYKGTIMNDCIVLNLDGLVLTYLRDSALSAEADISSVEIPETVEGAQVYIATCGVIDSDSCDFELFKNMGDFVVVLNPDGTGTIDFFDIFFDLSYNEMTIDAGGSMMFYTIEGDTLTLCVNETQVYICKLLQ